MPPFIGLQPIGLRQTGTQLLDLLCAPTRAERRGADVASPAAPARPAVRASSRPGGPRHRSEFRSHQARGTIAAAAGRFQGAAPSAATAWLGMIAIVLHLNASAAAALAADRCPGDVTTLALRECLGRKLVETDRALAGALNGVAASARREPGGTFLPLWQQFSEGLLSGGDPGRQLRAFQRERRQICQYINSMSLQGSGFGVFVLSCELDLSDALLLQLRN